MALNKEIMPPTDFATLKPGINIQGFNFAILNNFLYVFGGGSAEYGTPNAQKIYIYDIIADSWSTREDPKMPTNLMMSAVCTYNDEIYFFGGINITGVVKYNPVLKTWTTIKLANIESINPTSNIFASKPQVVGNKAYFLGITPIGDSTHLNTQTRLGVYDFVDNTYTIIGLPLPSNVFHMNLFKDDENHDRITTVQFDLADNSMAVNNYDYPTRIVDIAGCYKTTIGAFTPIICSDINDEDYFACARMQDGQLRVNLMKYKGLTGEETIADSIEIGFKKPVTDMSFSMPSVNCAANKNENGNIYIPVYADAEKTTLGILAIYQPEYIINSEQPIETTVLNELSGIREIIGCNIYCTEPDGTFIRFAFSCDHGPYKVFDHVTSKWVNITDQTTKYMIFHNEGMTRGTVEGLTRVEWQGLIGTTGAATTINALVNLMSVDENYTPTVSEIRFRVVL